MIADINPPSQTVGYGVNASFNCMAFGSPDLAYSWETLGAVFVGDDSPRLISTDTPTLVITNVGPNDDGTYRCTLSVSGMEIGSREAKLITKGCLSTCVCRVCCLGIYYVKHETTPDSY